MKRVAFIMPGTLPMPPVNGGAVELLADQYLRTSKLACSVRFDVYSGSGNSREIKVGNVTYENIPSSNLVLRTWYHYLNMFSTNYKGNAYIHKLIERIQDLNVYDAIVVENMPEFGILIRKMGFNNKLLLHLHNDYIDANYKYLKQIKKTYDEILVVSNYINRQICAHLYPINTSVVYNGIDISCFTDISQADSRTLKNSLGISETQRILLYSGRISYEKGVSFLLDAFEQVNDGSYTLIIIGMPAYSNKNKKDTFMSEMQKRHSRNVIWLGYIPHEKMPLYYSIEDLGIVPSVCNEAFGLTLLEHLASGNMAISSDKGGLPEIMPDEFKRYIISTEDLSQFSDRIAYQIKEHFKNRRITEININDLKQRFDAQTFVTSFDKRLIKTLGNILK